MTMLAENYEYVIGGDPDRDTIDLAVLDNATGATRAHIEASADGAGYEQMLDWAAKNHAPGRRVWALEGTGSFAAGLAEALAQAGEDVVEVGGLRRARGTKNDRLDAIRAARTAMAREHQASLRVRGLREAVRALSATRHGVLVSRNCETPRCLYGHRTRKGRMGPGRLRTPRWISESSFALCAIAGS